MARLNLSVGDNFYATLTPGGGHSASRPMIRNSRRPWKSRGEGMKIYRNALAELAK